jgi:hypothetical protein
MNSLPRMLESGLASTYSPLPWHTGSEEPSDTGAPAPSTHAHLPSLLLSVRSRPEAVVLFPTPQSLLRPIRCRDDSYITFRPLNCSCQTCRLRLHQFILYRCYLNVSFPFTITTAYHPIFVARTLFIDVVTYLDETNVLALLTETLTADVETVFADQTGFVGADAAVRRSH